MQRTQVHTNAWSERFSAFSAIAERERSVENSDAAFRIRIA
jgi:hypothetical protein